jgi:hypothetical protein
MAPGADALLDAFCVEHGVAPDDLGRALKAARFLVREASRRNVDLEGFAEDLALLSSDGALARVLLRGFEAGRAQVRREALARTIANHGRVLRDVEWRVDVIAASTQGDALRAPVAFLTLRYEEDGEQKVITLQALPDVLQKLEAACQILRR